MKIVVLNYFCCVAAFLHSLFVVVGVFGSFNTTDREILNFVFESVVNFIVVVSFKCG